MKNFVLPFMLAASATASAQGADKRPNIILILADDMRLPAALAFEEQH